MTKCPVCTSKKFHQWYTLERMGKTFSVVRCENCTLAYQHPMPNKTDIEAMYDEEYFEGKGFDTTVNYVKEALQEGIKHQFNHLRLEQFEKMCEGRKILDVGCAMGTFLKAAKERKWDVHGVEFSSAAAKKAIKLFGKQKIHLGTLAFAPFPKNFFDCITMFDVIEHMDDPVAVLRECRSFLRPGGVLIVETANIDSLVAKIRKKQWGYFLLGHLVYFSRKTLRLALQKAGFRSVDILYGDEVSVVRKASLYSSPFSKIRAFLFGSVRKIGIGDLSVGGMLAIARK